MSAPSSTDGNGSHLRLPEDGSTLSLLTLMQLVQADQEHRWSAGDKATVEEYLQRYPQLRHSTEAIVALLFHELRLREQGGEQPRLEDFTARFPEAAELLAGLLSLRRSLNAESSCSEQFPSPTVETPTIEPPQPADAAGPPTTRLTLGGAEAVAPEVRLVQVPGYTILGILGRGGMGIVFKAQQLTPRRIVALKMILNAEYAGDDEHRRFQAEADIVAQLAHPHIVQVYEVGDHNGLPYYSLEYCPGGSLEKQLDGTPWEADRAATLVRVVAQAVHVAHQAGLVHRDLKPANVLLTADSTPKVTDFGLAKRLDVPGHTPTGAVMGTPPYMAPEQADGKGKAITPAADVYALGTILYELLTGRPPFKAATPVETVLRLLTEDPVPVRRLRPSVPRDLETICHRCLEKGPRQRYESAAALAEDLRRFKAREPVLACPVGPLARLGKWARRRPTVAALLLMVLVVTAAGLAGILLAYREAVQQRKAADEGADKARQEKSRADDTAEELKQAVKRLEDEKEKARKHAKRADDKAEEARQHAKRADDMREEALWQAAFSHTGRAEERLQAQNHSGAQSVLDLVSAKHRGWEYRYLRRQAEGTALVLQGHTGGVVALDCSPDGSHIVSASEDHSAKVWDARTGVEVATLQGHTDAVWSVCCSPDGRSIASASKDQTVMVWDARTGKLVRALRGHTGAVLCVKYSPDSSRIASAAQDNTVKVWDARSGNLITTLRGHTGAVLGVSYSPDGSRLATASGDRTVKEWDAKTGAELATLEGHEDTVNCVVFSPDGANLATGSDDKTIKVWDVKTSDIIATLRGGHTNSVVSVAYSPDGSRIASASWDETVKVWDVQTETVVDALRGHREAVSCVAYSPDGWRIVTASFDMTVKVWPAKSGTNVTTLQGHQFAVKSVSGSHDGSRLASASFDKTVKVWDARTGTVVATLRGHELPVTCVAYSPDDRYIASASLDKTVKVWDARSGTVVATLRGHGDSVTAVAYSADGSRIASACGDGTVKVWDARTGKEVLPLQAHKGSTLSVSFSPDGSQIATAGEDMTVKVWDANTGNLVKSLEGHDDRVNCVSYSPDGLHLASGSEDATVILWNAKTLERIEPLEGHAGPVSSVSFSPDGWRIASGSKDATVAVWDVKTRQEVATLRGHEGTVYGVSYLGQDGLRIATASGDKTVKVWDARARYDRWAEEAQRQRTQAPLWYEASAAAAETRRDPFAAEFHRGRLAEGDNRRLLAWAKLADGDRDGYAQSLQTLRSLRREEPALAAVVVRAAVLVPDPGIPGNELMSLARSCLQNDPQSWQCRELVGAALHRDGESREAVRELEEAVRRHGKDGSLWSRLFLALAHQRLGHDKEADDWRAKALLADTWEDAVLQRQLLFELDTARRPAKP